MSKRLSYRIFVILILISIWFGTYRTAQQKDGLLHVRFFDVGQGDAVFIETPSGIQILIDGGPDGKVLQKLGQYMPMWDRSIDMLVLSHPHSDHLTGLLSVLERYDVSAIVRADVIYDSSQFERWQELSAVEGAQIIDAQAGRVFDFGNDVRLRIVHPEQSEDGRKTKFPNEDSVVAVLEYGGTEVIFTGDLEAKTEKKIMAFGRNIRADVLKVPHHGSKTGLEDVFLNSVGPKAAVISVGADNRYGHPAQLILDKLEKNSIPYYRTDTGGDIELVSDGEKIIITKQK